MKSKKSPYRIEQAFKYQGEDWWRWWIWVEASSDELDEIMEVKYMLHPTFSPPVVTVDSRDDKFRFETEGWGIFPIHATILLRNAEIIILQHELLLEYPDGRANYK